MWNVTLETVVSKTKHSKTKTEARSTQTSKTKHPKLENEDPYLENEAPYLENEDPKISKTKQPKLETTVGLISATLRLKWCNPNQVEAADASAPPEVHKIHPKVL